MTTAALPSVAATVSPARTAALVNQYRAIEAFEALRAVQVIGEKRVDHQGARARRLQLDVPRISSRCSPSGAGHCPLRSVEYRLLTL